MRATNEFGRDLPVWDEGDYPYHGFYVYVESLGVLGVVRARTREEAYECVIDEIMHDADPADPDSYARSYDPTAEEFDLAEGVHYRSNGVPSNPGRTSYLAAEDLNGSHLYGPMSAAEVLARYNITVTEEDNETV